MRALGRVATRPTSACGPQTAHRRGLRLLAFVPRAVRCAVALVRISAQPCLPVSLRHPLHCAALRYRTERSTKTGFKGDSAAARLRNRDGDSVAARRVLYSIASACKRAQQFDRRTPSCKRSAA